MPYINERCGRAPEEAIICGRVHSFEAVLVLELQSNYRGRAPEEKTDVTIRVIKEALRLPDDTRPKWYLEGDIDPKPNDYLLPSKSPSSTTTREKIRRPSHFSVVV